MVATVAEYASKAPKVVTAEDVINSPVKAEANPPLGNVTEPVEGEKVIAQVTDWFKSKKTGSK
jgi:hypothetical protein